MTVPPAVLTETAKAAIRAWPRVLDLRSVKIAWSMRTDGRLGWVHAVVCDEPRTGREVVGFFDVDESLLKEGQVSV